MKNYHFKVKYGFGSLDIVKITDEELEKALYAQKYAVVVQLGNKQINGKYIISIEPDYQKYTGWYDSYEPKTGEDFAQIKRDCPPEIDEVIRDKREKVDFLVAHKRLDLIGKNISVPELENGTKKLN
ncbi:MAG: hypothetical protein WC499_02645 [Patescibacteria group bacterium]